MAPTARPRRPISSSDDECTISTEKSPAATASAATASSVAGPEMRRARNWCTATRTPRRTSSSDGDDPDERHARRAIRGGERGATTGGRRGASGRRFARAPHGALGAGVEHGRDPFDSLRWPFMPLRKCPSATESELSTIRLVLSTTSMRTPSPAFSSAATRGVAWNASASTPSRLLPSLTTAATETTDRCERRVVDGAGRGETILPRRLPPGLVALDEVGGAARGHGVEAVPLGDRDLGGVEPRKHADEEGARCAARPAGSGRPRSAARGRASARRRCRARRARAALRGPHRRRPG